MSKKFKKAVNLFTGKSLFDIAKPVVDNFTGQAARDAASAQAKQQDALAQQQATIAQNAAQLQASNAVDNAVNVVAGGSADTADSLMGDNRRKRTRSVASQLGG